MNTGTTKTNLVTCQVSCLEFDELLEVLTLKNQIQSLFVENTNIKMTKKFRGGITVYNINIYPLKILQCCRERTTTAVLKILQNTYNTNTNTIKMRPKLKILQCCRGRTTTSSATRAPTARSRCPGSLSALRPTMRLSAFNVTLRGGDEQIYPMWIMCGTKRGGGDSQ